MVYNSIIYDDDQIVSNINTHVEVGIWAASMKGATITYRGTIRDKSYLSQIENPQIGDIYIDPAIQESYIFTGSQWCDIPM